MVSRSVFDKRDATTFAVLTWSSTSSNRRFLFELQALAFWIVVAIFVAMTYLAR